MNRINLQQTGGFPLETNTLDFMQSAYNIFNDLGAVVGDKSIIKGCILTGSSVSDGVIYVNGELLAFRGGTLQSTIIIREEIQLMEFEDGTTKPVYKIRYAKFGTGIDAMPWSDFVRPKTLLELSDEEIPDATETVKGIAKLATQAEANTSNNDQTIITPKKLNDRVATTSRRGVVELATSTETLGNDNSRAVTPQGLNNRLNGFVEKLHSGTVYLGDAADGTNSLIQVDIPNVGTSNYLVLGSFRSVSESHWNDDNDIFFTTVKRALTYFKIGVREVASVAQNVYFDYIIVKL